jgi:hypothetical protein
MRIYDVEAAASTTTKATKATTSLNIQQEN